MPFQPRSRLPEVLGCADVSLVILRKGIGTGSLPSKTFSILASGRPLIASVDELSETWNLIQSAQAGLCIEPDNPLELVKAILLLKNDQELARTIWTKWAYLGGKEAFDTICNNSIRGITKKSNRSERFEWETFKLNVKHANHSLSKNKRRLRMTQTKVLVTGAGGFIGHHLVTYLRNRGYWVRGVDIKAPRVFQN